MRKFYVAFLNEDYDTVKLIIDLKQGEKANAETFQSKINKLYDTHQWAPYCNEVLSWSLIEE
jgi:hypothetical protein